MSANIETGIPRIEALTVKNYRALQDVSFEDLSPLTVLLGPNGSGKSTVFDVFAFLSQCFSQSLRQAWESRGRFKELRSRGSAGPITFEIKYREKAQTPIITYLLEINEDSKGPVVTKETLSWRRGQRGKPFNFLHFSNGSGQVISGEAPEERDTRVNRDLTHRDLIAVNTLGQLAEHPRVSALRDFITGWHLSYLTTDSTRSFTQAGPQEKLSASGDNIGNVIQFLQEQHPAVFDSIIEKLRRRIPQLEKVSTKTMEDNRLLLQLSDAPFEDPILAKYISDGTLKMLAYLILLYDPVPSPLVGIEEPENQLHPKLLGPLTEECQSASGHSQLMVTTHSPYVVNGLKPNQLWIVARDVRGYTVARRAADIDGVNEMVQHGAALGDLWMEGHFGFGNPLV